MHPVNESLRQASLHLQEGQFDSAIVALQAGLAAAPSDPTLHYNLARVLFHLGRRGEGFDHLDLARKAEPDSPVLLAEWAREAMRDGRAEVIGALRSGPDHPLVQGLLAAALQARGLDEEAVSIADRALAIDPQQADALAARVCGLRALGHVHEAYMAAGKAASLRPDVAEFLRWRAFYGLYLDSVSASENMANHRAFAATLPAEQPIPRRSRSGALRIGWVSADFRRHSVARFAGPLIRALGQLGAVNFAYSNSEISDDWTDALRPLFERWRGVASLSDEHVRAQVLADDIDVLVDLSGLSSGHRLGVFSMRAAPIQLTAIGYPHSTGVPAMDFRLVDAITDPDDEGLTERALRVPGPFLCFDEGPVQPLPEPEGPFTFGCLATVEKISALTLRLWAEILAARPEAQLLVKSRSLQPEAARRALLERMEAASIRREQVQIQGATPSHADHLDVLGKIDLVVDTSPYAGTTTTIEALQRGKPVLTLVGRSHASRVGASLLLAAGAPAWSMASSEPEYVASGVRADRALLRSWDASTARMRDSSLLAEAVLRFLEQRSLELS